MEEGGIVMDVMPDETRRLPSASAHVQLSLLRIQGPSYALQRSERLRISLNMGPAFRARTVGQQGQGAIACGRNALLVTPPGLSLTHQAETRAGHAGAPEPARLATFFVSPELLADCVTDLRFEPADVRVSYRALEPGAVLLPLAQALLADLLAGCPQGRRATEHLARTLVCRLLLRLREAADPEISSAANDPISRVCRHIEANLQEPLSLSSLAALAGWSQYHFCRVFSEAAGKSPHQFVMAARIEAARRLLWGPEGDKAKPGLSMLDVALACGFNSSSHFSTQFRRSTGQSPRAWRTGRARQFGAETL